MLPLARLFRRAGLVCLGLVLLVAAPVASAAGPAVTADFDGDGLCDRAELSLHEPSAIHVWLSGTQTTWIVRSSTPVLGLAARDLDGDRRDELIASGTSAGLQIWTDRRKGFAPFHVKRLARAPIVRPTRHSVDDGPLDAAADIDQTAPPPFALALIPPARAPARVAARALPRAPVCPDSSLVLAPFGPRPPPRFL